MSRLSGEAYGICQYANGQYFLDHPDDLVRRFVVAIPFFNTTGFLKENKKQTAVCFLYGFQVSHRGYELPPCQASGPI
jgi:hypothetical protein